MNGYYDKSRALLVFQVCANSEKLEAPPTREQLLALFDAGVEAARAEVLRGTDVATFRADYLPERAAAVDALPKLQYLACSRCMTVRAVSLETVSFVCEGLFKSGCPTPDYRSVVDRAFD